MQPEDVDPSVGTTRRRLVERARDIWANQLVETGARNNLLFYRDLKRGTLDLGDADPRWVDRLLRGERVRLGRIFGEDPESRLPDAVKRVQTLHAKAVEHLEERGLRTLHLGCGLATWQLERGTATPRAPVLLRRLAIHPLGGAQREFELELEEEMELNPVLAHVLATEFEVHLDRTTLDPRLDGEIDTREELTEAYRWLADQAKDVPGFTIGDRLVVGTFSYAKLPMVVDLAESIEDLVESDLIAAIAGDEEAQAAVRANDAAVQVSIDAPDVTPPADEFLILDADASQQFAINSVVAGRNLIVKGPPGTGKSQTISNLISTLVARGKTVLFVAEKRAAIDAVVTRLSRAGLENVVFDLHSETGSRRKLAQRLAHSLQDVRESTRPDHSDTHEELVENREELKDHDRALHERRAPWGRSVYELQAELTGLPADASSTVRFRGETLSALDAEDGPRREAAIARFASLGGTTLPTSDRPWAHARVTTSDEARRASELLHELQAQRLPAARTAFEACCQTSALPQPGTIAEWPAHLALWHEVAQHLEIAKPEIYDAPLDRLAADLEKAREGGLGRVMASLFSGSYKRARAEGRSLLQGEVDDERLIALIDASDAQIHRWRACGGASRPTAPELLAEAAAAHTLLVEGVAELEQILGRDGLLDQSVEDLAELLDTLAGDLATLTVLPEIHDLRTELSRAGLAELLAMLVERKADASRSRELFRHAWLTSVLDEVRLTDRRVGAFSADNLERAVNDFQALDEVHIERTVERVRRLYAERATTARDAHPQEAQIIENQAHRKRGHLPLRRLVERAPNVLLALKPCWAVSPLLVSQILPSDMRFDVVVFDEASQVTPADAVPSIMRGHRVVVAGDERQLPPTAFFTSATAEEEEIDEEIVDATQGFESILDVLSALIPFRTLEWHYRSRDERLIAFSNVHVYDRSLTTFPGVGGDIPVRHVRVDAPASVAGAESSVHEVSRVVDLVIQHAETRPEESLGVIALGITHADRIDQALRETLALRRDLDHFFDDSRAERFFVKNLERVQGDERDAIILSLGFAKGADGRLRHNFGPINLEGGERRLNVAVTRARSRMTLVSSFASGDIDPSRSSARGVALLRQYVQFAESGGEYLGDHVPTHPALNPFEIDVRDTLTAAGIPLTPQLGASGYYIDFAAGHPDRPGDHVLAIECDGAAYHSAPTARDRDRLRQQQLERLGWRFHRIWSTDWFNDKEKARDRAVKAWNEAVARADAAEQIEAAAEPARAPSTPAPDGEPPRLRLVGDEQLSIPPVAPTSPTPAREGMCPVPPGRPIQGYTQAELRAVVRWVDSDTRLRTREELLSEVMATLGFKRRGARIGEAIDKAISMERDSRDEVV